ncbi:MAG: M24 family metallopeptidase, partial [bacterium]
RDIINEAGYEDNFKHGVGHGLGIQVHEAPKISYTSDDTIKPGMVFTDEPGIYISEWGGVRIEDDLLITENGCEVLNQSEKTLIEI